MYHQRKILFSSFALFITALIGISIVIGSVSADPIPPDVDNEEYMHDTELISNEDGTLVYDLYLGVETQSDVYPLNQPIDISAYDMTGYNQSVEDINDVEEIENSDQYKEIINDNAILSPTNSPRYVPSLARDDELLIESSFELTLPINDLLNNSSSLDKDILFVVENNRSDEVYWFVEDSQTVEGPLPPGMSSNLIQLEDDVLDISEVQYPSAYRISEEASGFGEEEQIPETDRPFLGTVDNYTGMLNNNLDYATVSGDSSGFNFVTRFDSITNTSVYTLGVLYDIETDDESASVTANPLHPTGEQIVEATEYELPSNPDDSEYCREVNGQNLCMLHFDESEVEDIAALSELYVQFETDENINMNINCMSNISGYVESDGENVCGYTDEESTVEDTNYVLSILTEDGQSENAFVDTDNPVLQYRVSELGDSEESDQFTLNVYENSQVDSSGELDDKENPLETYEVNEFNEYIDITTSLDVPDEYFFVLCNEGTCSIEDSVSYDTITLSYDDKEVSNIETFSPVISKPLAVDSLDRETVVNTKTREMITDNTPNHSEWELTQPEPVIEDYSGEIQHQVSVEVYEDKAQDAKDGQIIPEMMENLPEEYHSYNFEVNNIHVEEKETRTMKIPTEDEITDYVAFEEGWTNVLDQNTRIIETDTERENFQVADGEQFRNIVNQGNWYPIREEDIDNIIEREEFVYDTRLAREDPDDCLNCLPTELVEHEDGGHATERLENSVDEITEVIETGGNYWVKSDEEPQLITDGVEYEPPTGYDETETADEVFTNNIMDRMEIGYLLRESNYSERELYYWEYSPEISSPMFERSVESTADTFVRNKYEVTYEVTFDVENEDIYEYQKEETERVYNYEENISWIDLSESEIEDGVMVSIDFNEAEQDVSFEWNSEIHSQDINEQICDEERQFSIGTFPTTENLTQDITVLEDKYDSEGGKPVVHTCDIDGSEEIVRVGMKHESPGIYDYNVKTGEESETGVVEVIPERENESEEESELGSRAKITELYAVNDQIDYNIGTVPIRGEIQSQVHNLHDEYEIVVDPADYVNADAISCSDIGEEYEKEVLYELVTEEDNGLIVEEIERCINENNSDDFIDIRYRSITYEYESIEAGVVESCPENYEQNEQDGEIICSSNIDLGPEEFTLYDGSSYNPIPKGAYRPIDIVGNEITFSECDQGTVEVRDNGNVVCEHDGTDIRFATETVNDWVASNMSIEHMEEASGVKTIWESDNVVPSNEDEYIEKFSTTINPRVAEFDISDGTVEFDVQLRNKTTSDVKHEETFEVDLCSSDPAEDFEDIPVEDLGEHHCDEFDTLLTGEKDIPENIAIDSDAEHVITIEDAVNHYEDSGLDGSERDYTIEGFAYDACPYTQEFPRDQEMLIEDEEFKTVTISAETPDELEQEEERIRGIIAGQYSPTGDPCEREDDIDFDIPTIENQETNDAYKNCQRLAQREDHDDKTYDGLYGLQEELTLLDQTNDELVDVYCDMRTAGGEWTQIGQLEEESTLEEQESLFGDEGYQIKEDTDNYTISAGDVIEDDTWDTIVENVENYGENDESELYPQLLIEELDEQGDTREWAGYELHSKYDPEYDVEGELNELVHLETVSETEMIEDNDYMDIRINTHINQNNQLDVHITYHGRENIVNAYDELDKIHYVDIEFDVSVGSGEYNSGDLWEGFTIEDQEFTDPEDGRIGKVIGHERRDRTGSGQEEAIRDFALVTDDLDSGPPYDEYDGVNVIEHDSIEDGEEITINVEVERDAKEVRDLGGDRWEAVEVEAEKTVKVNETEILPYKDYISKPVHYVNEMSNTLTKVISNADTETFDSDDIEIDDSVDEVDINYDTDYDGMYGPVPEINAPEQKEIEENSKHVNSNCLYPFDSSEELKDKCVTNMKYDDTGEKEHIELAQFASKSNDENKFIDNAHRKQTILEITKDKESGKIETLSCFGNESEDCNISMRLGNDHDVLDEFDYEPKVKEKTEEIEVVDGKISGWWSDSGISDEPEWNYSSEAPHGSDYEITAYSGSSERFGGVEFHLELDKDLEEEDIALSTEVDVSENTNSDADAEPFVIDVAPYTSLDVHDKNYSVSNAPEFGRYENSVVIITSYELDLSGSCTYGGVPGVSEPYDEWGYTIEVEFYNEKDGDKIGDKEIDVLVDVCEENDGEYSGRPYGYAPWWYNDNSLDLI